MKLEQYISELLYQYDCVIVPGLGGFVANYKPATIQPIQNTFSPPSKSISFNKNLNQNDGLLTNFIAQQEDFSFDAAAKKVADYVTKVNRKLQVKKRFSLAGIGVLFLDTESRIQFEPSHTVNYLLKSYGLPVYQKQPIQRVSIESRITKQFVDKTLPSVAAQAATSKNSKRWMYSAALVLLAFGAGWMTNTTDWSSDLSYANLNPYVTNTKTTYVPLPPVATILPTNQPSLTAQLNAAHTKEDYVALNLDENENPVIVRLKEKTVAVADSTRVTPTRIILHYHIVTGCFSEKKNARKMVRMLKHEGFDAFIVGKRKGLWTVSCSSFETKKEAKNALPHAKNYNTKAWILKHTI